MSAPESVDLVGEGAIESAAALLLRDMILSRAVRTVPVVAPGVGADWTVTVTGGFYWQVLAAKGRLVTSAVVSNRTPIVDYRDADGTRLGIQPANTVVPASTTTDFFWAVGYGAGLAAGNVQGSPLASDLPLAPGSLVRSVTVNLDVGDQWSVVTLVVREWSEWSIFNYLDNFGEYLGRVK